MTSPEHLNHDQLRLFMTGDEIKSLVSDSVDRMPEYEEWRDGEVQTVPAETMDEMWAGKSSKRHQEMALNEGIQRHVTLQTNPDGTFTMGQGHHRVQASSDLAKKGHTIYLPVVYDTDWNYSGLEKDDYERQYPQAPKERF
jgi:hypothetical protein